MTAKDGGEPPKPLEGLEEASPDYMGFSHEELTEMVSTINAGQVGSISQLWADLGNSFVQFSNDLSDAMNATKSEWQGPAGEAARDYTSRLGNWFGAAGHAAEEGGMGVSRQSDAGGLTQNAMPEPIEFSMADATSMMASSGPFEWASTAGEIQQRFEEKALRHQEAARIVEQYDRELYDSARAMPDLGRPPMMTGDGGEPPIPPPPPRQWPPERRTVPPDTGGDDRVVDTRTGETGDDKGQTTKQETVITPPETKPPVPPTPPRPPVVPPPVTPPVVPPVGPPIGGPGRGPGDAGRGGAGRGGVGAGRGPGGAGGRGAGGPGSGFGPRGGPGGAGVPGAGARGGPGAGMGPLGGQGAPGRGGSAGAGGRGGAGGMPMGGGSPRGQGEEDGEHKRPDYLIEPDPDEVFGTDEMTAPPVIGE